MKGLLCWLQHRGAWIVFRPGLLPLQIDAEYFCPLCGTGNGGGRAGQLLGLASA